MNIQLPDFSKICVLVVGDIMLDEYWQGDVSRISPEAPVPVVLIENNEKRPGGAGNVALNIASLGAKVKLFGLVGDDASADSLEKYLLAAKVDCRFKRLKDRATITKLRVMSKHHQLIRLDFEAKFNEAHSQLLLESFINNLTGIDAVVLSDYNKGSLLKSRDFIIAARKKNIPVFVDPKNIDFSHYRGATVITPNLKEFIATVGSCDTEREIAAKGLAMIDNYQIDNLLITRGEHGMTLIRKGHEETHIATRAQQVYDVTGAGDTVIAVLAASVAAGLPLEQAVHLANIAAGIVVAKLGTAAVSVPELRKAAQKTIVGGIVDEEQLLLAIAAAHDRGETIVMTNGCFDILHPGHVAYLDQAKKLGNYLIVAVNDDASVKRLKGSDRPINDLSKRMAVLAGLSAVDWVIPFSEDTPEKLIGKLLPDILVKGGDYRPEEIAGADCVIKHGGKVIVLDFVAGHSTTSIIAKMKEGQ